MGFKQGGRAGYGLRRMLVGPARNPKQILELGERKSIATDRVILVPGPPEEVQCVRDIFRMLISENRTVYGIARELNRRGIGYVGHGTWDYQAVYHILTRPKYVGCHVFNRTSAKLYTPTVQVPKSDWVVTPNAFEPVVEPALFGKAQRILQSRTFNKSNDHILADLKRLLRSKGRLSLSLIRDCPYLPSPTTFRGRFGNLRETYARVGYGRPEQFSNVDKRQRTRALRDGLISQIVEAAPCKLEILQRSARWRMKLRLPQGLTVSILVVPPTMAWKNTIRWIVQPNRREASFVTLLARLNKDHSAFMDFYVLPRIAKQRRFRIALNDSWLKSGVRLRIFRDSAMSLLLSLMPVRCRMGMKIRSKLRSRQRLARAFQQVWHSELRMGNRRASQSASTSRRISLSIWTERLRPQSGQTVSTLSFRRSTEAAFSSRARGRAKEPHITSGHG